MNSVPIRPTLESFARMTYLAASSTMLMMRKSKQGRRRSAIVEMVLHATAVHFTPLEPRNWSIWQLSSKI